MENTQPLPNVNPIKTSDEPDLPPGTFEYIDDKKKWKKFLEICGLVVLAVIPAILSFYKIDYSIARVYQVVNPTDIGTLPSAYQTWGSVVKATQKLIQPIVAPAQISPTSTPEPSKYPAPTTQQTQSTNQSSQSQNQAPIYPTQTFNQTTQTQEDTYPASPPSPTPKPEPISAPTPTSEYVDPAIAACYYKDRNEKCSYVSQFGYVVQGRCRTSGGSLICIPFSY